MRSGSCLLTATLAAGFVLLGLPSSTFAQQPVSGQAIVSVSQLPEAPQTQIALAEAAPLAAQTSDGPEPATPSQTTPAKAGSAAGGSGSAGGPSSQSTAQQPGGKKSRRGSAEAQAAATESRPGSISGTVTDLNDDVIPGATVVLEGPVAADRRMVVVNERGNFIFDGLKPGIPYHVTISGQGFINWASSALILQPGQYMFLTGCQLKISGGVTSVTVYSSPEQIAVEQVKIEEQQRVFGIIPNFYVAYDSNAVPLTTKLKFKLALRVSVDPVTFAGAAFIAGIDQAASTPNYVEGAKGYGQRVGAVYTGGFTDIMIGGAILPSLLHQDPRYYYQGTGTKKSRILHALSNPFVCKGDNGRRQPNYSSMGGDLASDAISNAYYPASNRGAGLMIENFSIDTGERMVSSLVQEFVLHKFTRRDKNKD
jgi:hypothetical protein